MTQVEQTKLQLGDWVSGTTVDDERIRGYVEMLGKDLRSALIRVTESDREDGVGRVAESLISKLELLQVESGMDEKALLDLIDVALSVRDKEWFTELASLLNALRGKPTKLRPSSPKSYTPIIHRRIWMD